MLMLHSHTISVFFCIVRSTTFNIFPATTTQFLTLSAGCGIVFIPLHLCFGWMLIICLCLSVRPPVCHLLRLQWTHEVTGRRWRQPLCLYNKDNSLQDVYKSAFHFSALWVIQACSVCVCEWRVSLYSPTGSSEVGWWWGRGLAISELIARDRK